MRTALVFALFLSVSTPALGAQAAVSGIVKDEAGGAVSGAVVQVTGSSGLAQQTVP